MIYFDLLPAILVALFSALLLYGFAGRRWVEIAAWLSFLALPGIIVSPAPIAPQTAWIQALLLACLTLVIWDRRAPWGVTHHPVLARLKRLAGWGFAALAAFALSRTAGQTELSTDAKRWLAGVLLDDGRFALWLGIAVVIVWNRQRKKRLPAYVSFTLIWTALHLSMLLGSPEAQHYADGSPAILVIALTYAMGAWAFEQLLPRYSWILWVLILAHDVRAWWEILR